MEHDRVEQVIPHGGNGDIARGRGGRVEQAQLVNNADLERRVDVSNGRGGRDMPAQQRSGDPDRADNVVPARRPDAEQIALRHIHHRLVDRTPQRAQVTQRGHGTRGEAGEALRRGRVQPAALGLQPARVGEVVQRNHRGNAAPAQRKKHGPVAIERGVVEDAFARLDPAPLDREPVGVLAQCSRAIKIRLGIAPPAACVAGAVAVPDPAGLLLPIPPLVVAVLALDLVRAGGGAP